MNKQINLTKFFFLGLGCAMLFFTAACQNESSRQTDEGNAIKQDSMDVAYTDSANTKTLVLPYEVIFNEDKASFEIKPSTEKSAVALDKDELAEALNIKYPEIGLELGSVAGDTLFVRIADATYLTQNFGTSGARTYLAEATYAFTELPNINVVHFDFKEGDHAMPGDYKRSSFSTMEDGNDAF